MRTHDVEIYGNTIYMDPAASGSPAPVRVLSGTYGNVNFRNNVFMAAPGMKFVRSTPNLTLGQLGFQGNAYWADDGGFDVEAGGTIYTSLAAWQATGQEMVGVTPVGVHADPTLVSPASPELLTDSAQLATLLAYKAQPGSPIIDAGVDLQSLFGIDPGPRDFYGTPVPQGSALDMGAAEAPTPLPPIALALNQSSFAAGETLELTATVAPEAAPPSVDAYVALERPDGTLLFLQGNGKLAASPSPVASGWAPVAFSDVVFGATLTGTEPPGTWVWHAGLATPGSLDFPTGIVSVAFDVDSP